MTDRELLEAAARAAGYDVEWDEDAGHFERDYLAGGWYEAWDPLADDGDALRLQAHLRLQVDYRAGFVGVVRGAGPYIGQCPHDEAEPHDSAATRRAIVRAAASIGQAQGDGK